MFKELEQSLTDTLEVLGEGRQQINQVKIGLERETLRVDEKSGRLSKKDHPETLGSPLTHSRITTDFAEQMLEFVTQPHPKVEETINELETIQEFTYHALQDETFWPNSMPPTIESDAEIEIAHYGPSNSGRMKNLYRVGLEHRYGKMMQAITGIHFNFSFQDEFLKTLQKALNNRQDLQAFKTDRYLTLARNIARVGFVIPYFIGASAIMSKSFLCQKPNRFESLNEKDSILPEGTSFRLSDIGYGNNKCHFDISLNDIDTFIKNIHYAIKTPCKEFINIPVIKEGEYQQINNHILQIENEYYSSIRPKQIPKGDESFLESLHNRGIEYLELRSIDVDPRFKTGISLHSMRFIQTLLTACFLSDAATLESKEYSQTQKNIKLVAENGKRKDFHLSIANKVYRLDDALTAVMTWIKPVATLLGDDFIEAHSHFNAMIADPSKTPSSQILANVKKSGLDFQSYFFALAKEHYQRSTPSQLTNAETAAFKEEALRSLEQHQERESEEQIPFSEFLDNYFVMNL